MCNARSTTPFTKKNSSSASSSSRSDSEPLLTTTAPVCAPEQTEIDISNLSAEDLQALKQEDPFLYYSIPSVRRAALHLEEPDLSRSRLEESATVVKRCTRVSFECHTDLLMADLLGDLDESYDQIELEQLEQDFSKLLGLEYRSLQ